VIVDDNDWLKEDRDVSEALKRAVRVVMHTEEED
jgi:hypothetical protein